MVVEEDVAEVAEVGRLYARGASLTEAASTTNVSSLATGRSWLDRPVFGGATCTMVERAADVFALSFRANFAPYWLHALGKGHRAHRLDNVQYETLHELSAAIRLCAALPEAEALAAQRVALSTPLASTLSMLEAADANSRKQNTCVRPFSLAILENRRNKREIA